MSSFKFIVISYRWAHLIIDFFPTNWPAVAIMLTLAEFDLAFLRRLSNLVVALYISSPSTSSSKHSYHIFFRFCLNEGSFEQGSKELRALGEEFNAEFSSEPVLIEGINRYKSNKLYFPKYFVLHSRTFSIGAKKLQDQYRH